MTEMSTILENECEEEYDFVDIGLLANNFDKEYDFLDIVEKSEQIKKEEEYEEEEDDKIENSDLKETLFARTIHTKLNMKPARERKSYSPDELINCDQCKHSTPYPSNLKKHKRIVHEKVRALCVICNQQFADLNVHNDVVHEKVKKFKCDECEYSCYRLYGLKKHKDNRHKNLRLRHSCPQCFVKCSDIESHIQRVHINSMPIESNFPCRDCAFNGKTISSLRSHIRTIHEQIIIKCTVCAYNVNKWKITVHMKKHTTNKFECKLCDKTYREKRDLAKHILYVHRNLRYQCNFCEKQVPNLQAHIKFMHKKDAKLVDIDTTEESAQFHEIKVHLGENFVYNGEF